MSKICCWISLGQRSRAERASFAELSTEEVSSVEDIVSEVTRELAVEMLGGLVMVSREGQQKERSVGGGWEK